MLLAAMVGAVACLPGRAWAQSGDMSNFERTMRSLKHWWNYITREPDEGDVEAKDPGKFVARTSPDPRSWSDGGITLSWIGHSTFLINLEGTTILLIEQNAMAALNVADYGYVVETGEIVLEGTGKDLLSDERVKKAYLGET